MWAVRFWVNFPLLPDIKANRKNLTLASFALDAYGYCPCSDRETPTETFIAISHEAMPKTLDPE